MAVIDVQFSTIQPPSNEADDVIFQVTFRNCQSMPSLTYRLGMSLESEGKYPTPLSLRRHGFLAITKAAKELGSGFTITPMASEQPDVQVIKLVLHKSLIESRFEMYKRVYTDAVIENMSFDIKLFAWWLTGSTSSETLEFKRFNEARVFSDQPITLRARTERVAAAQPNSTANEITDREEAPVRKVIEARFTTLQAPSQDTQHIELLVKLNTLIEIPTTFKYYLSMLPGNLKIRPMQIKVALDETTSDAIDTAAADESSFSVTVSKRVVEQAFADTQYQRRYPDVDINQMTFAVDMEITGQGFVHSERFEYAQFDEAQPIAAEEPIANAETLQELEEPEERLQEEVGNDAQVEPLPQESDETPLPTPRPVMRTGYVDRLIDPVQLPVVNADEDPQLAAEIARAIQMSLNPEVVHHDPVQLPAVNGDEDAEIARAIQMSLNPEVVYHENEVTNSNTDVDMNYPPVLEADNQSNLTPSINPEPQWSPNQKTTPEESWFVRYRWWLVLGAGGALVAVIAIVLVQRYYKTKPAPSKQNMTTLHFNTAHNEPVNECHAIDIEAQ